MKFMLTYHVIHHPNSTYFIEKTTQYVMNEVRDDNIILANDLQVSLTIIHYNPNATSRFDVDLTITNLESTNRPPTTEEISTVCIVCFRDYNDALISGFVPK
ncbi:unnamed protein product [Eruca vesicaria subsp. sativa]|uniref:Uncharacterized protein n=1 Tax=Eruca vesicaria subsp. sativa TaxID=29727 RepID=A0ABC8JRS7_ERUVS|nr:unnamed protein product [Eruca vesicaria subsp. sativa]